MIPRIGFQHDPTGSKVIIQAAFANVDASTTDAALIAAVAGKRIVVLSIFAHAQGTVETNVTLNSKPASVTAGSAITSTKQIGPNSGWVQNRGTPVDYLFSTKNGEGLSVTTGAGSAVGIDVTYVLLD